MILLLSALVACTPDEPGGNGPGLAPDPQPAPMCQVQPDNALRIDCSYVLDEDAPLLVQVRKDGLEIDRATSDTPARTHAFTFWNLDPETTYTLRAVPGGRTDRAWEESVTTDPLPEVVDLAIERSGAPTVEHVLFPFQCGGPGHLVLVRASDGQVVWYQDITGGTQLGKNIRVDGFEFDAASGTVLALLGHLGVREFTFEGEVTFEAGKVLDPPLGLPTHHDAHRLGDRRYVLNADAHIEADGAYVMDGVYVLAPDGSVEAEWSMRDHVTPSGGGPGGGYWQAEYPDAVDYTHTNNLYVDPSGDWLLSSRATNTTLKVRGDPDAADFGEIVWALNTWLGVPFASDFEVISSNGVTDQLILSDQHHTTFDDDGLLMMFDNGRPNDHSRGVALALDEANGVADIVDAWPLDQHCPIQGSIFRLPNQHVLLTCPTLRTFYEFAPGETTPLFTMGVQCAQGDEKPLVVRGQPVFLP